MKYHNPTTYATSAIGLRLNKAKLKFLVPEFFKVLVRIKFLLSNNAKNPVVESIQEHIYYGDSQGALVVSCSPLIIAAYNEDIDCVVMLKYKKRIQRLFKFNIGDRLICVNTFGNALPMQADLIPGPKDSKVWKQVYPIIAEMVSDDAHLIDKRKKEIGDAGYDYIQQLSSEYLKLKPNIFRNGLPVYSSESG